MKLVWPGDRRGGDKNAHPPDLPDSEYTDSLLSYDGDAEFEEARSIATSYETEYFEEASRRSKRRSEGELNASTEPFSHVLTGPFPGGPRRTSGSRRTSTSRITRALFWIAGADERHMLGQKKEYFFYQLLGFSVTLTAAAASVGMTLFIRLSVPGAWLRDISFGLFWGLIIFWLDRWLVARLSYGPLESRNDGREPSAGWTKWIGYVGRFLLGVLLAFTISSPIVLALFQPEINQQVALNQTLDKSAASQQVQDRSDFVARAQAIDQAVAAANAAEQQKDAAAKAAQQALDDEISGRGGTGVPGCAAECVEKRKVLQSALAEDAAAHDTATAVQAQAQADRRALDADIKQAVASESASIDGSTGSLARERALFDVMNAHPILYVRWGSISGLLLLVDLMPILLKLTSSGRYSQTLHDRSIRLNAVREALQDSMRENAELEEHRVLADMHAYNLKGRHDLGFEQVELDRTVLSQVRRVKAECYSELQIEQMRLEHELRLFELRAYHAREMEMTRRRLALPAHSTHDPAGSWPVGQPTWSSPSIVNGRWSIVGELPHADSGGAGRVYLAADARVGDGRAQFVVKLVQVGDVARPLHGLSVVQSARQQLLNEQMWTLHIRSEFVAPLRDTGLDPRHGPFIVTDRYPTTLAQQLRTEGFSPSLGWALRITEEILRGLVDSYDQAGLVHLDIKPANIALDEHDHVRLLDFGLARQADVVGERVTQAAQGTRWYAPPEQLSGRRGRWASSACDVRAVFAVLYEIITGWPPLYREALDRGLVDHRGNEDPERVVALWELLLTGTPVEPDDIVATLPEAVNDLIMRGLSGSPVERAPGPDSLEVRNALNDVVKLRAGVERFADGRFARPSTSYHAPRSRSRIPVMGTRDSLSTSTTEPLAKTMPTPSEGRKTGT